jgi:hypothetical protein
MTAAEVRKRIRGLKPEQQRSVVCSLVGHSRIVEGCFDYVHCGRCGAQIGDQLAGVYNGAPESVRIGHNCATCRANYKKLTWRDKFLAKDPFVVVP